MESSRYRYAWSHPANYQEAKARLIGRQRYNWERRCFAARRRDELTWPMLLAGGLDRWGLLSEIARAIGVHRSTVRRDRTALMRSLV